MFKLIRFILELHGIFGLGLGGGGGGGDGGAQRMEDERQERIRAATAKINEIFNGGNRDALYGDHKKAVYELNTNEVNRQAAEAERANRFGLARSGLLGGSTNIDSVAEIDRRTNEGLLRAGGIADQAAADLKASDEKSRSNLISMAQSGIDTGSAATMAANALKVNADSVANQRSGASIGALFNDLSQAYLAGQIAGGTAAGSRLPQQQWLGVSSPSQTYAGNTARS